MEDNMDQPSPPSKPEQPQQPLTITFPDLEQHHQPIPPTSTTPQRRFLRPPIPLTHTSSLPNFNKNNVLPPRLFGSQMRRGSSPTNRPARSIYSLHDTRTWSEAELNAELDSDLRLNDSSSRHLSSPRSILQQHYSPAQSIHPLSFSKPPVELMRTLSQPSSFITSPTHHHNSPEDIFNYDNQLNKDLLLLTSFRRTLYLFLEAPSTSIAARIYSILHFLLIFVSVILVCVETQPQYYENDPPWTIWDTVMCFYFTLDFLARLYAVPNRLRYLTRMMTILDIVTIVPYWIDLFQPTSSTILVVLRILRIGRIFQIFRYLRSSPLIHITIQSIQRSREAFMLVLLYSMLGILIAASAMYVLERGVWDPQTHVWMRTADEPSPFQSIPHGFYWAVVTITTTGYGDVLPVTNGGRAVAGLTMLIGVSIIALPVSIIGSHFMAEWVEYQRLRLKSKLEVDGDNNSPGHQQPVSELSKGERIKQLMDQHDAMITLVQQAQDALNDICPSETYARYMRTKDKYQIAVARVQQLQEENENYRHEIAELQSQLKGQGRSTTPITFHSIQKAAGSAITRTLSRPSSLMRHKSQASVPARIQTTGLNDSRRRESITSRILSGGAMMLHTPPVLFGKNNRSTTDPGNLPGPSVYSGNAFCEEDKNSIPMLERQEVDPPTTKFHQMTTLNHDKVAGSSKDLQSMQGGLAPSSASGSAVDSVEGSTGEHSRLLLHTDGGADRVEPSSPILVGLIGHSTDRSNRTSRGD